MIETNPQFMNEQEQRIALAEWDGWKWYRRPATGPWSDKPMRALYNPLLVPEYVATLALADMSERECNEVFLWREGMIPDYLHDLNAVHGLILKLNGEQMRVFFAHLMPYPIPRLASVEDFIDAFRSEPNKQCEALLRTIRKWKD